MQSPDVRLVTEAKAPDLGAPGAALVGQAKQIGGGIMPAPLRFPTLTVERMWPNSTDHVRIMWTSTDGQTVYGFDQDGWFLKSTDGGQTWTPRGQIPQQAGGNIRGFGRANTFLRLKDGVTMLSFRLREGSSAPFTPIRIARSTDEGATWVDIDVDALMATGGPMGPTAWCEDPNTGHVYYGEYDASDTQTEVNLYRSTDKGATWTKFHTFPGPTSSSSDKVRHIHAVEWDPISQRIVVMTGDPEPAAGIYRVNAAGTGLEPWLLNRQITNALIDGYSFNQSARAIGFMPFPDYIAYAADSALGAVVRVKRSDMTNDGTTDTPVEVVYRLNSTAWFAARASDDGSRWVVSASQEGGGPGSRRIDRATHLYAVEDQGATVYEVGALPVTASGFVTIAPVSKADSGGDVFHIQTNNSVRWAVWRCQLVRGAGVQLPWPIRETQPDAFVWETVNHRVEGLAPGATIRFATLLTPQGARNLSIYEGAVKSVSGTLKLVVKLSTTEVWSTMERSARIAAQQGPSGRRIGSVPSSPGSEVYVEVTNTHSGNAATGDCRLVYGWCSSY